jgi:hypothetical protein
VNFSEDNFKAWAKGPSQTEADRCANAEAMVKKAIAADESLSALDISIFAQGSYRARTNVKQNSDVDICVCYKEGFYADYPKDKVNGDFGNKTGSLSYAKYKDLVQVALQNYFGPDGVTRGSKAFDVHENSYRVDADVVPTYEYRKYTGRKYTTSGRDHILYGVAFKPDQGDLIKNWPRQTYDNGVERNTETSRRYKRTIRVLKRIRDKMLEDGIISAEPIPSYLIECLLWNAKVSIFEHDAFTDIMRSFIVDVWNRTQPDRDCSKWFEVNGLKLLFGNHQPWNQAQVHAFLKSVWNYLGYKSK